HNLPYFFPHSTTTEIYTLSLHDALPILGRGARREGVPPAPHRLRRRPHRQHLQRVRPVLRAEPERVQRGQVRRARVHRVAAPGEDRKSTRLNSSHVKISYAVFCLKKKKR